MPGKAKGSRAQFTSVWAHRDGREGCRGTASAGAGTSSAACSSSLVMDLCHYLQSLCGGKWSHVKRPSQKETAKGIFQEAWDICSLGQTSFVQVRRLRGPGTRSAWGWCLPRYTKVPASYLTWETCLNDQVLRLLTAVTAACAAPRVVAFVRARWSRGAEPCRQRWYANPRHGAAQLLGTIYTYSSNKYLCLFSTKQLPSSYAQGLVDNAVQPSCFSLRWGKAGARRAGRQGERGGHWRRKPLPWSLSLAFLQGGRSRGGVVSTRVSKEHEGFTPGFMMWSVWVMKQLLSMSKWC